MSEYSEIKGLPPDFFAENLQKFLKNIKLRYPQIEEDSVIAFMSPSHPDRYDTDTKYYYYDLESNFYYLTGVTLPNCYFIIDYLYSKSTLFVEIPDEEEKIWCKVPSTSDIEEKFKIKTKDKKEVFEYLRQRNMKKIYVLDGDNMSSGSKVVQAVFNFEGQYEYLSSLIEPSKFIYTILCDCRRVKSEREKKLLKYIAKISNEAHMALMKYCKPGLNERDMENYFLQYLRNKYYTRFYAYNCICATGKNSSTLHYDLNDKELKSGDLFLTDMGIRFCQYCSDITTTFPVNGVFTEKQKKIYDIVLESNRKVIASIRPGITKYAEIDVLSKIVILEGLQRIGILKKGFDSIQMFKDGVARIFMPHSVSHLLGLDVHDVGRNGIEFKSLNILENGAFITVEPGIYFIDFLMDRALKDHVINKYIDTKVFEEYRNFGGVRIEDDVMINEDSVESYQAELPRTTEEIEKFMKK